jgi:hypothetical protein
MPSRKPTAKRKSRSGPNIEEWQRGTVRVRVPRRQAEALASVWACGPQDAVLRAVQEAVYREVPRLLTEDEERAASRGDDEYDRMRERDLLDRDS